MEATLLDFILDVTHLLLSDVTQHFAQHPFERVALHGSSLGLTWRGDRREAVVADVERGSEEVATLLCRIPITLLQPNHIVLRPQDTRHDDLVQRNTFYI